ncbi:mediator of RNA polymerase II transcription subunit 6 isoform X2 [Lingula anatina]|nr:mediator of RNA polymerase II transcription subunit 6 isoform X2 [Lingula anatina]|eukprot:XP_013394364.1 mediator of RNA polymerase II transcription subunit 6 isoform X2 [Lingula anatina]
MDYFSERSNPFYDRTSNNEIIKMQRLNPEQLNNMTGLEYILLHVQEPILYVIRKQHRHSSTQVTPLADFYIIAGVVYQAPDLGSVINARLLNTLSNLESAFDEAKSYSRYHPSKGYSWEFKNQEEIDKAKAKEKKKKEEPSSLFQRQRVDILLTEWAKKHPPKYTAAPQADKQQDENKEQIKLEMKTEKSETASQSSHTSSRGPAEKKPRLR